MNCHTLGDVRRRYPDESLLDDRTMICTRRVVDALDLYECSLPTAPSPGRIYRVSDTVVRHVIVDPTDPRFVRHVPRALVVVS